MQKEYCSAEVIFEHCTVLWQYSNLLKKSTQIFEHQISNLQVLNRCNVNFFQTSIFPLRKSVGKHSVIAQNACSTPLHEQHLFSNFTLT
jgi:hypothetical protein